MKRIALVILASALASPAYASSRTDLREGFAALRRHNYENAITLLSRAIDAGDLSRRDMALAYHWRGAEYLGLREYDRAIADLDRAIERNPALATAYHDRAIAWRRKGEHARAIADDSEAIRLWPNWHDWFIGRAMSYAAVGRNEDALADYDRALYLHPDLPEALAGRAGVYLAVGKRDKAGEDAARALKLDRALVTSSPAFAETAAALGLSP